MYRALLIFIGCLLSFLCDAADLIPKSAPNCDVDIPPSSSGESETHAILIKVFPRRSVAGSGYSGCQTMWLQQGSSWGKFSVNYFVKGELLVWWSAVDDKNSTGLFCQFSSGKLVAGSHNDCYEPATLGLSASFAPGCIEAAIRDGKMSEQCNASLDADR